MKTFKEICGCILFARSYKACAGGRILINAGATTMRHVRVSRTAAKSPRWYGIAVSRCADAVFDTAPTNCRLACDLGERGSRCSS